MPSRERFKKVMGPRSGGTHTHTDVQVTFSHGSALQQLQCGVSFLFFSFYGFLFSETFSFVWASSPGGQKKKKKKSGGILPPSLSVCLPGSGEKENEWWYEAGIDRAGEERVRFMCIEIS